MTSSARHHRPTALQIALAVIAVVAAGCSGGSGESTTTTDPVPSTATPTTAPQGPPAGATETGWSDLSIGSCFDPIDDPAADDLAVWLTDCAVPHRYEVFDIFEYEGDGAGGTSYPGIAVVQNWSEDQCFSRFEAFVGTRWTLSDLDIAVWWPTEDSWARGDGAVVCAVMDHSGRRLEGTQRASNR